ncbi:MAG: hypothetical protein ABEI06_09170 [Halobacteriaceae archaeon]
MNSHLFKIISEKLTKQTSLAFFVAGSLLLGSTLLKGLHWFTEVSPPVILIALIASAGLLTAFIGIIGLYARLTAYSKHLSYLGTIYSVGTAGIVTLMFGWVILDHILRAFEIASLGSLPEIVFLVVIALIAMAFIFVSITVTVADVVSDLVGYFLFGFIATWIGLLGLEIIVNGNVPNWIYFGIYSFQPITLLSIGYYLNSESETVRHKTENPITSTG